MAFNEVSCWKNTVGRVRWDPTLCNTKDAKGFEIFIVSRVGFDVPVWYLLLYWQPQNVHCLRQWRQLKGSYYTIEKTLYRLSLFLETCKIELFLVTSSGLFVLGLSVLWAFHYNLVDQGSSLQMLDGNLFQVHPPPIWICGNPLLLTSVKSRSDLRDLHLKNAIPLGSSHPSKSSWVISR